METAIKIGLLCKRRQRQEIFDSKAANSPERVRTNPKEYRNCAQRLQDVETNVLYDKFYTHEVHNFISCCSENNMYSNNKT
eukprot:snap_masked-scaffold_79-processed-gene-0.42-mRNA-1 protein AED:1.00 eAED:1.00 QI:0/0/0/0/1/1/2/0/80